MLEGLAEEGKAIHKLPLEGSLGGTCETFHGTSCSH